MKRPGPHMRALILARGGNLSPDEARYWAECAVAVAREGPLSRASDEVIAERLLPKMRQTTRTSTP